MDAEAVIQALCSEDSNSENSFCSEHIATFPDEQEEVSDMEVCAIDQPVSYNSLVK